MYDFGRMLERFTQLFIWSVLALLLGSVVLAQENSGQILGTVTDQSGAVVPDAKITITNPSLPRGLETTTDATGRYKFPRVPIGTFTVTVTKSGFSTVRQHGVEVKLGSEVTYNPRLAIGQVTETVEVVAAALSLDTTSSRTSTNINVGQFDNLARGRDYTSLLAIAPGVRLENRAGGGYGIQVDGASGSENAYIIDGVDTTDMFSGGLRSQYALPLQFIQEVQVKSGGFEAEYGGANGGVINIATRSGTNAYHGNIEFQFTNNQLNPRPRGYWQRSPANADLADFFAPKKDTYRDLWPGFLIGGPLVKDRLFFLGSYEPTFRRAERVNRYAPPVGARQYTQETVQHYALTRLDFNPTQRWQINTSYLWAPSRSKGGLPDTDVRIPAPTNDQSVLGGYTPSQAYTASATFSPTGRVLLSARYGYKYLNVKGGNYGLPANAWIRYLNSTDRAPGVPPEFAGPNGFQNISSPFKVLKNIQTRHNVYVDGSWITNLAGQQHTFKAGYALNRMGNDISDDYPNGRFDIHWGDAFTRGSFTNVRGNYGYYVWEDGVRHTARVDGHNQGVYLQDAWKIYRTVTINAGVRVESEFLPPYRKEQGGVKIANPVAFGWGDKIAPRIGAAWDVRGDGRWKLSGFFGYFYDVMKYELARGSFGGDIWFSSVYKLDNPNVYLLSKQSPGALGEKIVTYDNRTVPINARGELDGLDPNLKPYKTRQFIASIDHRLTSRVTAGVRYSRNDLLAAIEDIGVLDAEDNEVYLIGNPGFGRTRRDPQHIYDGKTPNGKEFLVPRATRQYDGVEFRVYGQVARAINLTASYTYSRLWGNFSGLANSDESGRSDPGVSRAFDLPYYYFDSSGDQKNKFGRLATDRPHAFKLFGNYELKTRAGSSFISINQEAFSGLPDSTSVIYLSAPTFPFGRGDLGRTPFLTQTDFAVSHTVPVSERTRLKFEGQALNVFNQATVISRVTQLNRASAISEARLPLAKFFSGYKVSDFVYPSSRTPPYNPIYALPGGNYRAGGSGAYQAGRSVRFGVTFMF